MCDSDNGVGGNIQDTAYVALAFNSVGGPARAAANNLGRWLARQNLIDGSWIEADGYEYPEVEGEALRALTSKIGTNFTSDGFDFGNGKMNSSWNRGMFKKARPFNE